MDNSNTTVLQAVSLDVFGVSDHEAVIFSWVVYSLVCQVINIFGVMANIINIICFIHLGFQESTNVSLLGLAVSDIGCLTTQFLINLFYTPTFRAADLEFETKDVIYLTGCIPHLAFSRITNWITALVTFERCLCVLAPLKIKSLFTTRRTSAVMACIFIISFIGAAPVYVVNKLDFKFSSLKNKTIYGVVSTEDREIVEIFTFSINSFALPFIAFIIIVICTTTLVIKLKNVEKWRQQSANNSNFQNVSIRNQKVAKMVVVISGLFIVCFVPTTVSMLAVALVPELYFTGKYINVVLIMGGICLLLESINSSMNIIIYYRMSTKFRYCFKIVCSFSLQKVIQ